MGASYALTGADTIIINDIPLSDFADGDIGVLEIGNDLFGMSTGKNGNTIFAYDEKGNNATLTVRILMSSNDDKRLNGLVPDSKNFASTVLINGSVIKLVGDGSGKISYNTYMLQGGMVQRKPSISTNVNAETNQAVVEYTIAFANAQRSIA
jgi:hypothetical protein